MKKKATTKRKPDPSHLTRGWAFEAHAGVYHFEHFPMREAERMREGRERVWVIETINWTYAEGDDRQVHRNLYFAFTLGDAIGMAAQFEIAWKEVAEEIVTIRPATDDESETYGQAWDHFNALAPAAISERVPS